MQLKAELDLCVNNRHVHAIELKGNSHRIREPLAFKSVSTISPGRNEPARVVSLLSLSLASVLRAPEIRFASSFGGRSPLPVFRNRYTDMASGERERAAAGSACQLPGDHVADASQL
jgi:hypothetical protein